MLSKTLYSSLAVLTVFCCCLEANAQSGSRNAVPSFSPAPAVQNFSTAPANIQPAPSATYAAPGSYSPAATPLDTVRVQATSPRATAPAPQPFPNSGCPNCQLRAGQSNATQTRTYNLPATPMTTAAPTYQAAPVYSRVTNTQPRIVYRQPSPTYYRPTVQSYTPAVRYYPTQSYAPTRVYRSSGCSGY
jgi:hypothetical protein